MRKCASVRCLPNLPMVGKAPEIETPKAYSVIATVHLVFVGY